MIVALQDVPYDGQAIVAGASACSSASTLDQFNVVTVPQIVSNFKSLGLSSTYSGYLVLDLEVPVSPQNWYKQSAAYFASIKRRVDTIRSIVTKCKLGIYATSYQPYVGDIHTVWPDGTSWAQTCHGYILAATEGVFDNVDFMCPLVAAMWGTSDSHFPTNTLSAIAAMTFSQSFGKPIVPMARFKIYNPASLSNGKSAPTVSLLPFTPEAILVWAASKSDVP